MRQTGENRHEPIITFGRRARPAQILALDRIIEKHEGPERWESTLKYADPEFIEIAGYPVLLPVDREHHPNITILRCIASEDHRTLTIFLKDITHVTDPGTSISRRAM